MALLPLSTLNRMAHCSMQPMQRHTFQQVDAQRLFGPQSARRPKSSSRRSDVFQASSSAALTREPSAEVTDAKRTADTNQRVREGHFEADLVLRQVRA